MRGEDDEDDASRPVCLPLLLCNQVARSLPLSSLFQCRHPRHNTPAGTRSPLLLSSTAFAEITRSHWDSLTARIEGKATAKTTQRISPPSLALFPLCRIKRGTKSSGKDEISDGITTT